MPIYDFQDRFAPDVESGKKLHTIRKRRRRPTKVGETMYLYNRLRSKAPRKLRLDNPKCTKVLPIEIHCKGVFLDGRKLSRTELHKLAVSDGFKGVSDFFEFWQRVHKLREDKPLVGFDFLGWEPLAQQKEALAHGN